MLQAKCKTKCGYGEKGQVIELDQKELTERQAVMLEVYEAPVVKKVDSVEPTDVTAEVDSVEPTDVTAEVDSVEPTDVTAELVKALSKKTKEELEEILVEGEVEYDDSATEKVLAQLIVEHDLVEAE